MPKVVFCVPTVERPYPAFLDSLERSVPVIEGAGWEHSSVYEIGNPYISCARGEMLRKALNEKPDCVVFLDHDLSWDAEDLLTLIETPGDVVAGTYRFKKDEEEYMGTMFTGPHGTPLVRDDGCIEAANVPAGFLKVTVSAVYQFMGRFPELKYGDDLNPHIDLFNHGAHEGIWYGEDYAFCRRWNEIGKVWCIPNLNINHHTTEKEYKGNFHEYLMRLPGGCNDNSN